MKLQVFDLLGREVALLVDEWKTPGDYRATFTAGGLASGAYLYRLQIRGTGRIMQRGEPSGFSAVKKLLLVR